MKSTKIALIAALIYAGAAALSCAQSPAAQAHFDGKRALADVKAQMDMGPRLMDSPAHAKVVDWIQASLKSAGWTAEIHEATKGAIKIRNIVGRRGEGRPWVILGAHYDCRFLSDQDPDPAKRALPVPGANDGASGVAVLLEVARALPKDLNKRVELLFIDAEDNGNIPGWDWCLGSKAFAAELKEKPDAVVIIDMIGDADLNIYREGFSDQKLTTEIWKIAARLKFPQFINETKYQMEDDHLPFIAKGITAIDIIDFDYPYWHTTGDTLDKVSAESLRAVGETLLAWLTGK
jgi:Zn-dependent M28 family amino/carboxypeptidase